MPAQACPSPTPLSGSLPAMSAVCTQRRALHPRPLLLSMCLRYPSPQSLPPSSLSTEWIAPRGTLLPVLCAQTHVCGQYNSPPEVGAPYRLRIDISHPTHMSQGLWAPLASPGQGPYSQLPCGLGDGMEVFAGCLQPSSLWTWQPGEASLTEQLLSVPSKRQMGEGEATR